jgi:hypothetical protein
VFLSTLTLQEVDSDDNCVEMSLPLLSGVGALLVDTLNQETSVVSSIHMGPNDQPIGGEMSISPSEGSAGYTTFTLTLTD